MSTSTRLHGQTYVPEPGWSQLPAIFGRVYCLAELALYELERKDADPARARQYLEDAMSHAEGLGFMRVRGEQ
jgi:hypothetical protein